MQSRVGWSPEFPFLPWIGFVKGGAGSNGGLTIGGRKPSLGCLVMYPPTFSTRHRSNERLRRLRERFGPDVRAHEVDHDEDHLTSTHPRFSPVRTFFLGQVWWVDRAALGDRRPYREGSSHLPALVTRKQEISGAPVECAPSGRGRSGQAGGAEVFVPADCMERLSTETVFHLLYRRPVSRAAFSADVGKISGSDLQRLSAQLERLRRDPSSGGAADV